MPTQNHTTSLEFLPIPGFPFYRAGSDGTILSCLVRGGKGKGSRRRGDHWWPLKSCTDSGGYKIVTLFVSPGAEPKILKVHRLVLEAFVGPCPFGKECCHSNGVRTDNRLVNLRWDTHRANWADRVRHGRGQDGSSNVRAKLTEDDIPRIRQLAAEGITQVKIAERFGVARPTVSDIVTRRKWKHVP